MKLSLKMNPRLFDLLGTGRNQEKALRTRGDISHGTDEDEGDC